MSARNGSPIRLLASVLLLSLLLAPPPVRAEPLDANCFQQCPVTRTVNRIVARASHTFSNNAATKFADWVAYDVVPADIGPSQRRSWRPDPLLPPDETLEPADYKGAHKALKTDRGHQAPLASFTGAPGWQATNYLSNITPQKSALNQGPWKELEAAVRVLARSGAGRVHVLTGTGKSAWRSGQYAAGASWLRGNRLVIRGDAAQLRFQRLDSMASQSSASMERPSKRPSSCRPVGEVTLISVR